MKRFVMLTFAVIGLCFSVALFAHDAGPPGLDQNPISAVYTADYQALYAVVAVAVSTEITTTHQVFAYQMEDRIAVRDLTKFIMINGTYSLNYSDNDYCLNQSQYLPSARKHGLSNRDVGLRCSNSHSGYPNRLQL